MGALHISMLGVAIVALIGIIVSFLCMTGIIGGKVAGAEDYDNPYLFWLICSVVVFVLDAALFGVVTLWGKDPTHISPIALGGLTLYFIAKFVNRLGITLFNWGRQLVAPAAAATTKPWWLSKTILANSAVGALLLAEANISSLQGVLPASKYQIVAFGLPVINMLLRVYTTKGLALKSIVPQAEAAQ